MRVDKRRIGTALATRVFNPLVKWAVRRGIAPRSYAILETTGRRSGEARRTPVGHVLEDDTIWVVAEHGGRAGYVRNLQADQRVRIKVRGDWRTGTAHVVPDDDPHERLRKMGLRFNALVVRAMGTELLTVRIDLDPTGPGIGRTMGAMSSDPLDGL
ncbi:MAG: nitroreductase/quinone reductase family protein [Solirubrobacteraceae bacterium]